MYTLRVSEFRNIPQYAAMLVDTWMRSERDRQREMERERERWRERKRERERERERERKRERERWRERETIQNLCLPNPKPYIKP